MSAITGIFYRNGRSVPEEQIKKMNNRLSHRGPDGSSIWFEGPVGLGHQMLYTTPESLYEKLPFEEDGLVITADARIDNRKELSEKLDVQDKEEVSDSYFILKAYQKWGERCPEELLGDFTFAIWDKDKEKLFCARDHMGVKPFYYYLDDEMFVFGTEIKAILSIPVISNEINEKKIALFLMRDIMDDELTFYENIKSLPAAHSFLLNKNKVVKDKYWDLNPDLEIIMNSEREYAEKFLEIFSEAVKCRLRSHYPIGFELSGGLDSSSVVCTTKKILTEEQYTDLNVINTFSIVYSEIHECDEQYYIKKIITNDKIKPNFLKGDDTSPLEDINEILWYQDQPFFSPHMVNQIKSYRKISNNGIRVLITGEGGDEIVSHGGNYIRELFFTLNWKKLIEEINGHSQNFRQSRYKIFIKEVVIPSMPYSMRRLIRFILRKNTDPIVNEKFFKGLGIEKTDLNILIDHLGKMKTKEYHYFSINNPLTQTVFGIMDRSTASFNVEMRHPFFDKRLIEFCYSLPTEMKIKQGWGRYILRISMENILPQEIQWRQQKADLSGIYKRNLILFEKSTLKKIVYKDNENIKKFVNIKTVQDILKKYEYEKEGNIFELWLVILLYFWLNLVID